VPKQKRRAAWRVRREVYLRAAGRLDDFVKEGYAIERFERTWSVIIRGRTWGFAVLGRKTDRRNRVARGPVVVKPSVKKAEPPGRLH